MEVDALPLERGAVVELTEVSSSRRGRDRLATAHANSAQSLSPRSWFPQTQTDRELEEGSAVEPSQPPVKLLRRASSFQVVSQLDATPVKKSPRTYGAKFSNEETVALLREESRKLRETDVLVTSAEESSVEHWRAKILEVLVNLTSGVIAFLLSSTLAVSCASVIVGHGSPLAPHIAHFIDMNFLGTAVLSVVLAWQSQAPWTLGAIDVFVVPVMGTMADRITLNLDGDVDRIVPTTVVMVAMVSAILGSVFLIMGSLRVTSIANYMPYPVIAGFLSGIGAELMRNGVHMAAEEAFSMAFFTWEQQQLILPAVLFATMARLGQYLQWPVAISFPCLLVFSLVCFHFVATVWMGLSMEELAEAGWIFPWPADVVRATPMWYPWAKIDLSMVSWYTLFEECFGYLVSLVILGALKYSVATTSLSTLFGREISPDNEMRVIGIANIVSGALGCCGGCHYLSAMGIMKQFEAHEKVPALVCAVLLIALWIQGIRVLQFVPKFVFGGLILSVALHFLEAYFITPLQFLKRVERSILVLITASFLVIGMLQAVGLGVIISMIDLIWRINKVGCVHHETTGQFSRSSVDRSPEQVAYLDEHGSSIFVLRLQGYLFFGTSVNILERIETRIHSLNLDRLEFVVIDFGLVPSFDATALLNFRKATRFAERYGFEIYFCGLKPSIQANLRRNEITPSSKVHYIAGDVDRALELCENGLLPEDLRTHVRGTAKDWSVMSQLTLWEHFLALHDTEFEHLSGSKKLLPLAAYLDKQVVSKGERLCDRGVLTDTYFICFGEINIMVESEFSQNAIPGVAKELDDQPTTRVRAYSARVMAEETRWTPFLTEQSRLRKIGPGSIITPDSMIGVRADFYRYVATSDCVLLRLSPEAMENVEIKAPHTAVSVLKLINLRLATRFLYANKRVTQLSSLLYK
ncbi:hypothetical protein Poli38472_008212 [Pythium oligandrum]|uniref:STAS domain-containing protein n=1 Tax=Pythium oligandrum TaxID=41045 RepID=A0A8K1CN00_PYTOL|nr:hypothetical protein Poli38472_008212 [Pythium oligandrum]|eukprot:TMW65570.1 hypothetical protein Poli38472_008212 [Pythium oligandrum]